MEVLKWCGRAESVAWVAWTYGEVDYASAVVRWMNGEPSMALKEAG